MKSIVTRLLALGVLLCTLARVSYAQSITSRRLVEVVDISQPVVSPDGDKVAFRTEQASIERNSYDTVWYVQTMDGTSPPVRVATGGVPLRDSAGQSLPAAATWSPDGLWIYYRAQIGGKIDVWRAATDGSGAEPVTLDPADVRDFSLSKDGATLTYSVGATRSEVVRAELAEYHGGIHIDETVPIGQPLFRSGHIDGRPATQRYGKVWFDRASLLADIPDRWKAINLRDRTSRDAALKQIPHAPAASDLEAAQADTWKLAQDARSGRIAVLTRVGDGAGLSQKPDVELLMYPSMRTKRAVTCLDESCTRKSITGIQWRPDSDEVLFTVTDVTQGQAQTIYSWNVNTGRVHVVAHSQGLISGGRDPTSPCGLSSKVLVCVAADADRPPRLERIDLETGSRVILFAPNEALAHDIERSVPSHLLVWTDEKGRRFSGQYIPAHRASSERSPLFVSYYTCAGFLRGGFGDEWPLMPLAEHGISALCINQPTEHMLDAVKRYDEGLGAIKSAIDLLAARGEIDRTKVGVGGLSFGSEVAMWATSPRFE